MNKPFQLSTRITILVKDPGLNAPEYIRPFNISTSNVDVNFKVMLLERLTELELKGTDISIEVPSKSIIQRVNVNYDKDSNLYLLSGIDKLSLNTYFERLGSGQNRSTDDGRRVSITYSSRGRQRRSVQLCLKRL